MGRRVLEGVDPWGDPTEAVLFDLFVEAGVEARDARVAARHDDVLQEVVADALVGVLEGLYDRAGDALLLESDILR